MATVKSYVNGASMGRGNKAPVGGRRGNVNGWTRSAVRRHLAWLWSVDVAGLDGDGYGVTLTLRDTPASHEDWAALVARLQDPGAYWPPYPVPSVPLEARHFQDHRYWAGPTWVNTNWTIVRALERLGRTDEAADLRLRTLGLVDESGFAEYFSPTTGTGHGAPEFSWTAALTIDLTYDTSSSRSA